MALRQLPSVAVPETQKQVFSEAGVHSSLFEPDIVALGVSTRTTTQADGEYLVEQRTLATRRLRSWRSTGRYDIPANYLAVYQQAAGGVDWAVLAAIGDIECDHGRS